MRLLVGALVYYLPLFPSILNPKGAKIQSIEVNPDEGGSTKMKGGNLYLALPAGYLGSSFWGSLMIVAGFNVTFSKVVAGIIMFCMLLILYWAKNWLTRGMTVLTMAILGVLWWFKDGIGLRYFVLFLGVMSALYSLWDIVEDLIVRRVNESDAAMFSKICCKGAIPAQVWGVIWFLISMVFVAAAIIIALIVFKDPNAPL